MPTAAAFIVDMADSEVLGCSAAEEASAAAVVIVVVVDSGGDVATSSWSTSGSSYSDDGFRGNPDSLLALVGPEGEGSMEKRFAKEWSRINPLLLDPWSSIESNHREPSPAPPQFREGGGGWSSS